MDYKYRNCHMYTNSERVAFEHEWTKWRKATALCYNVVKNTMFYFIFVIIIIFCKYKMCSNDNNLSNKLMNS